MSLRIFGISCPHGLSSNLDVFLDVSLDGLNLSHLSSVPAQMDINYLGLISVRQVVWLLTSGHPLSVDSLVERFSALNMPIRILVPGNPIVDFPCQDIRQFLFVVNGADLI